MSEDTPFTEEKMEAIVGYCLTNQAFFMKCKDKIKSGWFTKNMTLGIIYEQLCQSYIVNKVFIKSVEEFKSESFFQEAKLQDREKYFKKIDVCVVDGTRRFNLDKIEKELTAFMRVY